MMRKEDRSSVGGVSTLSLLGIVFVTLKLCDVIAWSWWTVTAPFWAPLVMLLTMAALVGVFVGLVALLRKLAEWITRAKS